MGSPAREDPRDTGRGLSSRLRLSCTLLMRRRTRCCEVSGCVGLSVLQRLAYLRAEPADPGDGQVVELTHRLRVALREHGLQDAKDRALLLPGRRASDGAARQAHGAGFKRRREKAAPSFACLNADVVHAEEPAVSVGTRASGRDRRHRARMTAAAFDVGGVEPDVREGNAR